MDKVTPFLWFRNTADQAARFYTSLFPDSEIENIIPGPDGAAFIVDFTIMGRPYTAMNGGSTYALTPAFSMYVSCKDQAETDFYWHALTSNGGRESRCGWCIDRFGMSWQVVPMRLTELMSLPDREASGRAREAMLTMNKIDIDAMEAAAFSSMGGLK